uniref:Uncharacterized protein n=1 Tax=Eutreptiella gymnastica TaxID=73025 RepID=A0A7S4GC61_9EUGL
MHTRVIEPSLRDAHGTDGSAVAYRRDWQLTIKFCASVELDHGQALVERMVLGNAPFCIVEHLGHPWQAGRCADTGSLRVTPRVTHGPRRRRRGGHQLADRDLTEAVGRIVQG